MKLKFDFLKSADVPVDTFTYETAHGSLLSGVNSLKDASKLKESPHVEKPISHIAKSLTIQSPKHMQQKYNCFSVSSMVKYATTMKSSAAVESTVQSGRSHLKSSEFQSKEVLSSRIRRNLR